MKSMTVRGGGNSGTSKARTRVHKIQPPRRGDTKPKGASQPQNEGRKNLIFVPDTNVLLSDPEALFNLGEHDALLSRNVLFEVDRNKKPKGKTEEEGEVAMNARKVARVINYLAQSVPLERLSMGVRLVRPGVVKKTRKKVGRLYFNTPKKNEKFKCEFDLDLENPDHKILYECLEFMDKESRRSGVKRTLVLLSKDKNMRTFARMLGIQAEDYRNNAPSEESLRSTGIHHFPLSMLKVKNNPTGILPRPIVFEDGNTEYILQHRSFEDVIPYEFIIFGSRDEPETQRQYVVIEKRDQTTLRVRELYDYQYTHKVFYLHALNAEQNCLANGMLHLGVQLVIGGGKAGTGKTLFVLACACQMVKNGKRDRILITRDPVETGQGIGFLPGPLEAKVGKFLIGFEGNKAKLLKLLTQDIADKRRSYANKSKSDEVAEGEPDLPKVRKTRAQKREERRHQKRNKNRNSGSQKGYSADSPEVLELIKLREKLAGPGICIVSVGHLRGGNIEKNEVAIVDEAQHTDARLGKMLASRVVEGGMLVLVGDDDQNDLGIPLRKSGVAKLIDATQGTGLLCLVTLTQGERGSLPECIAKNYK